MLKEDSSNIKFELRFVKLDGSSSTVHSAEIAGSYWADLGQTYPVWTLEFHLLDFSMSGS